MASKAKASSSRTKAKAVAPEIPLAEWIVSGIGLLMVGTTVGYLVYASLTKEDSPPDVAVEVLSVVPLRQGYLAKFLARNLGEQGANDVHIMGIHGSGSTAEESEAVIDFLPGKSERRGGLFFSSEPSPKSLSLRASGYQEP
jgi:uncharacterized protein (TIGR02588 family)